MEALLASAFVVPRPTGLVLVAMLLVVLAYAQRFVGRAGALVVGLTGHVGATTIVALGLLSGIFHDVVDPSVRNDPDVGVSYVLACTMAFLTLFMAGRWRWVWSGGLALFWLLPGALERSFTDAGHAAALAIGWVMAFVSWRAVQAHLHHLGHGPEWHDDAPVRRVAHAAVPLPATPPDGGVGHCRRHRANVPLPTSTIPRTASSERTAHPSASGRVKTRWCCSRLATTYKIAPGA